MTKATTTTKRKKSGATLASPPFHLSSGDGDEGNNDSFPKVFEGVSRLLMGRKNIIVLVGAGISVSCGIPDFRSKDSGLYSTLDTEALGLSCPEELFDWEFFQEDPSPFYKFARNLYFPLGDGKKVEPSDSHKLLAMLEQKKMLLRVYSQNIDGLENVAGVSNRKMVYAHGSLQWATCCKCQHKVSCDEILPEISKGCVPSCQVVKKNKRSGNSATSSPANSPTPREPSRRSSTKKRQRTAGPDNVCGGVYKPAVTFFGETLHDNVRRTLESDRNKVDALIVIGTSLSVAPISKVIEYLPHDIPRILINRTIVHPAATIQSAGDDYEGDGIKDNDGVAQVPEFRKNYVFDAYLLGFCDDVTRALARQLFNKPVIPVSPERKRRRRNASTKTTKTIHDPYGGRLLTTVLDGNDKDLKADDWHSITVPPERVLLFPGALSSKDDSSSGEVTYREIAHCDGCSKRIRGVIHKCVTCFDYDLCQKCFPKLSKTHFDGKHQFNIERASS